MRTTTEVLGDSSCQMSVVPAGTMSRSPRV
ncbi:hypothetical protein M2165_003673 [Variovorax sp. TBS-050B]|nr:hypothetical protein [Variovorax sp. TBS-050B]